MHNYTTLCARLRQAFVGSVPTWQWCECERERLSASIFHPKNCECTTPLPILKCNAQWHSFQFVISPRSSIQHFIVTTVHFSALVECRVLLSTAAVFSYVGLCQVFIVKLMSQSGIAGTSLSSSCHLTWCLQHPGAAWL